MLKRPTPSDNEEDLLKQQKAFLKQKQGTKPKVKFDDNVQERSIASSSFDEDFKDHHITDVISDIIEREAKHFEAMPTPRYASGFPTVQHVDLQKHRADPKKKTSIFAQQFKKLKTGATNTDVPTEEVVKPVLHKASDSALEQSIHEENAAAMAKMSEDEILAKQQELLKMLDPVAIKYFKSRSKSHDAAKSPLLQESSSPHSAATVNARVMEASCDAVEATSSQQEPMDTTDTTVKQTTTHTVPHTRKSSEEQTPKIVGELKDFVNMDVVEKEKLEWMKDLPPVKEPLKDGHQARFDFQGELMAAQSEVPTNLGLHHHGDEPECAGYSIGELFHLVRSANVQQRSLALRVMARIIKKCYSGHYTGQLNTSLVAAMLDGGLVFIIRWALDDTTDNTISSAIMCLHALLVSESNENIIDSMTVWHNGLYLPAYCNTSATEEREASDDTSKTNAASGQDGSEQEQKTDDDVVKEDVVKALMRMLTLERFRYLIKKWRPAHPVVTHILQILTRFARHSSQVVQQMLQCSDLIRDIINYFLPFPTTWLGGGAGGDPSGSSAASGSVCSYNIPYTAAIKLVSVMCAAGRHFTSRMLSDFHIMKRISGYLVMEVSELPLPVTEATSLHEQCYTAWSTCLSYGYSTSYYSDVMYPILHNRLQHLYSSPVGSCAHVCMPHLVCTLEAIVHAATTATAQPAGGDKTSVAKPTSVDISFSQVDGLYTLVSLCAEQAAKHFMECFVDQKHDVRSLSTLLHFIASFTAVAPAQKSETCTMDTMTTFCKNTVEPLVRSNAFRYALKIMRDESALLSQSAADWSDQPSSIQLVHRAVVPDTGALDLCNAVNRILLAYSKLHVQSQAYSDYLTASDVVQYLRRCCQTKLTHTHNSFTMHDNYLQYHILSLARLHVQVQSMDIKLLHKAALWLLVRLQAGDQHIAHFLLSYVLFNSDFISFTVDKQSIDLQHMNLHDDVTLYSATGAKIHCTSSELVADGVAHLPTIRSTFLLAASSVFGENLNSRALCLHQPQNISKLQRGVACQTLVPSDWLFLPLIQLYNVSQDKPSAASGSSVSAVEQTIVYTLMYIYIVETQQHDVLHAVSLLTKISRLMCVFLAGDDLFLNKDIQKYLSALFKIYSHPVSLSRMNFTKPIPGMPSFYDYYVSFLQQYEATSFGDSLFTSFLLLPMQQNHPIELRRCVWGEYRQVLRSIFIPLNQLLLPVDNFLQPEETDIELLGLYMQALLSGTVTPQRTPLPYLIAVHHINRFYYSHTTEHTAFKTRLLQQAITTKDEVLKKHLIFYKNFDSSADFSLGMYEDLPTTRSFKYHEVLDTIEK